MAPTRATVRQKSGADYRAWTSELEERYFDGQTMESMEARIHRFGQTARSTSSGIQDHARLRDA